MTPAPGPAGPPDGAARGPAADSRAADEVRMEQTVGRLLQAGVLVAALVIALGGVALLLAEGDARADFGTFRPAPANERGIGAIVRGALAREPRAVVQLGLVLLVATPVARVALTLVAFARQRDRLYVAMTALVLALLLAGLLGGRLTH